MKYGTHHKGQRESNYPLGETQDTPPFGATDEKGYLVERTN
jgi:hypothetical protein